jgi:hypothetical protein
MRTGAAHVNFGEDVAVAAAVGNDEDCAFGAEGLHAATISTAAMAAPLT